MVRWGDNAGPPVKYGAENPRREQGSNPTFYQVVKLLDGAQIEDLFQDEMELDGYFDEAKD